MMMIQNLEDHIREAAQIGKEVFEEIHSWPELGNEEFKTATLIGKKLKAMGLGIERPLPTAVVVNIKGEGHDHTNKTVAFRADIDALPMAEEAMVRYRSRRAGLMHACGHDAHTGILIGAAQVLCRMQHLLPCNVRLIFQPDEEGQGGAERLIKTGVLKGIDQIFGFHVKPELTAGSVGFQYGTVHGESIMFQGTVKGASAHGARPNLGRDAIYGASEFISMCQSILSRDLEPGKAGVLTFGKIKGGEGQNILADKTEFEGILRGEDPSACQFLCSRMQSIAAGLSQALGIHIELDFQPGYKALINDEQSVNQVRRAAAGELIEIKQSSMTVDDFSFYLQHVPGAYFFLGSGFEGKQNSGLHTNTFHLNEECIAVGIETLVRLCME